MAAERPGGKVVDRSLDLVFGGIAQEDPSQKGPSETRATSIVSSGTSIVFGGGIPALVLPEKNSISFEDVAVFFSVEEWALLNLEQQTLYQEVMLENARNLASLSDERETKGSGQEAAASLSTARNEVTERMFGKQSLKKDQLKGRLAKRSPFQCADIHVMLAEDNIQEKEVCTGKIQQYLVMLHTRMSKQKRLAYKIPFKLAVVKYAKEHGNRAAERHFGPPPTEKMIREWRKQEDQLQKVDKSKHTFRGSAAKWPQLDVDMKEWITRQRNNGFSVSTKMIIYEAKRIAVEKGMQDFTGSPSWCYRFMKRCGLALRTKTRIVPKEYEYKILSFHKFVTDARMKNDFEIGQIGNMDEVLLNFDMPSNKIVDLKGDRTTTLTTSGQEKTHYTVVLSCCADGTKLPPMLIVKRENFPKEVIPQGVVVHVDEKGRMDENGMRVWVEKVWSKRPGGLLKKPALLVLDQFRAHISKTTKKSFKEVKTHLAVIPGGLTNQLQPLKVSINKPFKVFMREEWNKWMAAGNHNLTPPGRMKRPTITQVCEWVKTSWHSVKDEIVARSFKKCGISNALDGTEDSMTYESEESDIYDCEQLSFINSDTSNDEFLGFPEKFEP